MTHLRRENTSRVTRQVPVESYSDTLFGGSVRTMKMCKKCKEFKPTSTEYYLKSKRDRKHLSDVRDMCIPCFDSQTEKSRIRRTLRSPSKLNSIFINEESETYYGTLLVGGEVSSSKD